MNAVPIILERQKDSTPQRTRTEYLNMVKAESKTTWQKEFGSTVGVVLLLFLNHKSAQFFDKNTSKSIVYIDFEGP